MGRYDGHLTGARVTRLLFLTRYTALGSSSRYRVHQCLPAYSAAGLGFHVLPFHTDDYVRRFAGGRDWRVKARQVPYYLSRFWQRLRAVWQAGSFDLVIVEGEVFPFAPAIVDRLLWLRNRRVVLEYDDALFIYYGEMLDSPRLRRILGGKVADLMRRACAVIAGNDYLAAYARKYAARVEVVPTTVDLGRYPVAHPGGPPDSPLTLVWIGSPVTAPYLQAIAPALQALAARRDIVLRVIGAPGFTIPSVRVEALPWSDDNEVALLQACHIGLMPLPDDNYTRGKCGLKILQYFAACLPAVASPVGANRDIVQNGINGFLAGSPEEWTNRLDTLLSDREMRQRMGLAGRRTVEERYALAPAAQRLIAIYQSLAAGS
jgi:glycosyltransferase involved in cell wall biosynthesis